MLSFGRVISLNGLAQEKGTRILEVKASALSCQFLVSPIFAESGAKCQYPLRFRHGFRSKSGRGCSFRGIAISADG
jgi:hypothetical protein